MQNLSTGVIGINTNSKYIGHDGLPVHVEGKRATMRLVLVPLDERPVNVDLPRQVAAIAGVEIEIPPEHLLPNKRSPADLNALHAWTIEQASDKRTTHLIACIDTLVHGGLIPGRISNDSIRESLERLEIFRSIKEINPEIMVSAVSLIMRASDSYSAVEEPEYWSDYGKELHQLGADLHRALQGELTGSSARQETCGIIPSAIVQDFELRRLRNHIINLSSIAMHEESFIDTLALTADDTAPHSAGSAEQVWLRHWCRALPNGETVLMNPGADEVGAVLVARALTSVAGSPSFAIACGEPDGLQRVPNFENAPLLDSLMRQIKAAGGHLTLPGDRADIVLVAHSPDPARGDYFGQIPASDSDATARTVFEIKKALAAGSAVALADVRFSNGGDPQLVDLLADEDLLLQLSAYAGWNTAGNSIGCAVAQSIARWVGARLGTLNQIEADRGLLTRILDDRAYQSGIRPLLHAEVFGGEIGPVSEQQQLLACEQISASLQKYLDRITRGSDVWQVKDVKLPWSRSFEIALLLDPKAGGI